MAESLVAWYAATFSAPRLPGDFVTTIEETITWRMEELNEALRTRNWREVVRRGRPDNSITPRVILPLL